MLEWRAKACMILCTCRDDLNLHILLMFIGTFSLDVAKMYAEIFTQHVSLNCSYKKVGFSTAVSALRVQEIFEKFGGFSFSTFSFHCEILRIYFVNHS